MRLKIGDSVKVKDDVMCPDDDSFNLGGWQGRAIKIVDGTIGIRWDSVTLGQMPHEYIKQSEEEGLGWSEMYLSPEHVELASPRDSEETADKVREAIESTSFWLGHGDRGERILKVIVDAEDEIEAWRDHLLKTLTPPFDAKISEPQERGGLRYGDKVKVYGIIKASHHYGISVNIRRRRVRFVLPLCDLGISDKSSPNYTPLLDYCVWFANR
jgi:hypothetical protein